MTKRIFGYICAFVFCIYIIIVGVTVGIFYDSLCAQTKAELKIQTSIAAQGVEKSGSDYFDGLKADGYRVTWIDTDGKVLFDSSSDAANLGSHLDREEIKEAFESGLGESSRYSDTITSKQYYCAMLLSDGRVIRLSVSHESVWQMLVNLIYPIAYSSIAIVGVCIFIAYRISKRIVKPLNAINLDEPLKNKQYGEIQPLLNRLEQQQLSIRRQEEELKRKQDEFNAVTYGMKEGLILLNENNEIINSNHAAQTILAHGVDIERLLKEPVLEIDDRVYKIDLTPVRGQGAVVLIQDVTEKEQAEAMRREFTSNVSHELKTPLHSISGHAELMLNGLVKEQDKRQFIGQIYDESKRMIALVEDIIRLSSLEENSDFVKEPVELWECVKETALSLKNEADKAGVFLSAEGSPVTIFAVPRLVNVIIYNLVDNAIKYNGEQGSVWVIVKEQEDSAVLYVKDTGIGIPYEAQQRVFERFYRVDKSRSKSVGGTGLGLSIVKHAAKILGAQIELKSALGEGTTMIVRFPKEIKQTEEEEKPF